MKTWRIGNTYKNVKNVTIQDNSTIVVKSGSPCPTEHKGRTVDQLKNYVREVHRNVRDKSIYRNFIFPRMYADDFYGTIDDPSNLMEAETADDVDTELKIDGIKVNTDALFGNGGNYIIIHGSVGSGKTTLMKQLSITQSSQKDVVFMQFRHLDPTAVCTLKELVFFGLFHNFSEIEVDRYFSHIRENEKNSIIMIDGLDEYRGDLSQDNPFTNSNTNTINSWICGILKRDIFPLACLVIASRDEALTRLPEEMRPCKTVALAGFSKEAILEVCKQITKNNSTALEIIEHLKIHNRILYNLCSNPLFLNLIVKVSFKCLKDKTDLPKSLSEIMLHITTNVQASKNARIANSNNPELLKKIYELAYIITKKQKVIITAQDLESVGLTSSDVIDVVVTLPNPDTIVHDHVFEGDLYMTFIHRLFQDIFACIHALNMEVSSFRQFVEAEIMQPHWMVMWRLLCGILLSDVRPQLRKKVIKDYQSKCDNGIMKEICGIVTEKMRSLVGYKIQSEMYLLWILNEASDRSLVENLTEINLNGSILSLGDMQAISSVICLKDRWETLSLSLCHLTSEHMGVIEKTISDSHSMISILNLNIGRNDNIVGENLGNIVRQCQVKILNMRKCSIKSAQLQEFAKGVVRDGENVELREIHMGDNNKYGMEALGYVLRRCQTKVLVAEYCLTTPKDLGNFLLGYTGKQGCKDVPIALREFRMDWNRGVMSSELGHVVANCGISILGTESCDVTPKQLDQFLDAMISSNANQKFHMDEISLKDSHGIVGKSLAKFLKFCTVGKLNVQRCMISVQNLDDFHEELFNKENQVVDVSIKHLYIGDNTGVVSEKIGDIVARCGVETLEARLCGVTRKKLSDFERGMLLSGVPILLTTLYLGDNPDCCNEILANIIGRCQLRALDISRNKISPRELIKFAQHLGEVVGNRPAMESLNMKYVPLAIEYTEAIMQMCQLVHREIMLDGNDFAAKEEISKIMERQVSLKQRFKNSTHLFAKLPYWSLKSTYRDADILTMTSCGKRYIGETERQLNQRFGEHLRNIRGKTHLRPGNTNEDSSVAEHFKDVEVGALTNAPRQREQRRTLEQRLTKRPLGLNKRVVA